MEALKTKEEAAKAVQTYAHLIASMAIVTAERDQAQLQLTGKYQPKINAFVDQAALLKQQLQDWATENRELFGEEKHLEFSHGFLKFRKGQPGLVLLARWTWEKVLEKLESFPVTSQWQEYIRRKPEVNKRRLIEDTKPGGKLPEVKLRDIGLRVDQGEAFSIETKPDMVARDCDLMP